MATTETVNTTTELERAGQLARELLAVGYIREDSINRYKNVIRDIEAGQHLERVAVALTEMRASGELREEGNDRYQELMHCLGHVAGEEDDQADQAAAAPARTTIKRPVKKTKAKG